MPMLTKKHDDRAIDRLCKIVEAGDWTRAARELSSGTDPNATSSKIGLTPLQIAVQEDDVIMARLLVEAGANPDFFERGLSPAQDAIIHKKVEFKFLFGD